MASLAAVVNQQAARHAMRARNVLRAEVVKLNPLTVELMSSDQRLDDDDMDLSAWVEFYDEEFGIELGDTVLLQRESGEYVCFDVVGDGKSEYVTKSALAALTERVESLEQAA